MMLVLDPKKSTRMLLYRFVYGSLIVLLLCLFVTALLFSSAYLQKERNRAKISSEQVSSFLDFHYRLMTEEVWTENYEAVNFRIGLIARHLGNAAHNLVISDPAGKCLYVSQGTSCVVPKEMKTFLASAASDKKLLRFDNSSSRYIYFTPLAVGSVRKGFLFATFSDPYDFYRGDGIKLGFRLFTGPAVLVLVVWLLWLLVSQRWFVRPHFRAILEMERKEAVGSLATQVAHDIRSPLAALKTVIADPDIWGGDQRQLIMAAASRIEGIAGDLMANFLKTDRNAPDPFCFVIPIAEAIISEKRTVLRGLPNIDISLNRTKVTEELRAGITEIELSRVFSNLLNNSLEALKFCSSGKITVDICLAQGQIRVVIRDNGRGISNSILNRLGKFGGTYGKAEGAGIGLAHAREAIDRAGGSINIHSIEGAGTAVVIHIPQASRPEWLADPTMFAGAKRFVVLEDDESIMQVWKSKLSSFSTDFISDPEEFQASRYSSDVGFILDHQIVGSPIRGLDLIVSNKLGSRAILCTSHFNDPQLQTAVKAASAKMLPKFLIADFDVESLLTNRSSPGLSVTSLRTHDEVKGRLNV